MNRQSKKGPLHGRTRAGTGVALALAAAFVASCAGVENLSGTGSSGNGTGGTLVGTGGSGRGGSVSTALFGTWTRAILLAADDGTIHESRTTWEFRQDGSGIRTVLAWNLTAGFYDTVVTVAQWRTAGSQLTLSYIAPTTGTAAFIWSVNGDILTIGTDQFARVR